MTRYLIGFVVIAIMAVGFLTVQERDEPHEAQGVFVNPNLTGIYDASTDPGRLGTLGDAGFDLVVNYGTDGMTLDEQWQYANWAQYFGVQIVWDLANPAEPVSEKLATVGKVRTHPGTWGWYVGDEMKESELPGLKSLAYQIRQRTTKPLLYISRPFKWALRPFSEADVFDYGGPDVYPVGSPYGDPLVCPTADWAATMVRSRGEGLAMVLQAFSWSVDVGGNLPWPTYQQMRDMRDNARKCGDPGIELWFCYHCITGPYNSPPGYWQDVVAATQG